MSSLLIDRCRQEVTKFKDPKMEEGVADVGYSTMFLPFDYLNGSIVYSKTKNEEYTYPSIGIIDGSVVMYIGRSGSGKSSLALQMAANIVRPFKNGIIFFDDIEGGSNMSRRENLTKFFGEELKNRMVYRNAAISAENFYKRIAMIEEIKLKNRADYEYDTGLVDSLGKPIFKLVPTVYILDSLPMLTPDKIADEEELSGQMSATNISRTNTGVFKRIIPKLKSANIILLVINHILDKVETNPFQHTKATTSGLKQGETLPGGRATQYVSNNMIRIDDGQKLKASEGLGVDGKIVDVELVKSRTNANLKKVPLVFTYDHGFDEVLSLFVFLKSVGAVNTGTNCYFNGYENLKFRQKDFKQAISENPELMKAFMTIAKVELEKLLYDPRKEQNSVYDIMSDIVKI